MKRARFGPAGTDSGFAEAGYKKTVQIADYLIQKGLDHFEYQCGHGVRIGDAGAKALGWALAEKGVTASVHAPYFISLSSVDEQTRANSVGYILQAAKAAALMEAERIVIHSGSCSKMTRAEALELAKSTLMNARAALAAEGLENIRCCPETMGKINQLGTLDEVTELCLIDESFVPCVDFGHLYARNAGVIDYAGIFDAIENKLGEERLKNIHIHFSKIEYTEKGGEKRHLKFSDNIFGPDYRPLIELIAKKGLSPIIVCESADSQSNDAAEMKRFYESL